MKRPAVSGSGRVAGLAVGLGLTVFVGIANVSAEEAVLRPGYISGRIEIGGETITTVHLDARYSPYSASLNLSPNATSVTYTITVNVPEGTTANYTVSGYVFTTGGRYLALGLRTVPVEGFATSTLDILVDPGYVEGTITVNGGLLQGATIFAYQSTGAAYTYSFMSIGASGSFRLPVVPNTAIQVYGTGYVAGISYPLGPQVVAVASGQTVRADFVINHTPGGGGTSTGEIAGNFELRGPRPAFASVVEAFGPMYRGLSLQNGPYRLEQLKEGSYNLNARSIFTTDGNLISSELRYPNSSFSPARTVTVVGGQTTTVNVLADEAFINGAFRITGTRSQSDLYSASVVFRGSEGSSGGEATARVRRDGTFENVVTPGTWTPAQANLFFYHPDPVGYLAQTMSHNEVSTPTTVSGPGAVATRDLTYAFGAVTVNFRVLGGGLLSYPRLTGYCARNEPNFVYTSSFFVSTGDLQVNVPVGSVTFVATEETCDVEASALVGGSSTVFGRFSVTVVPGTEQQIDLSGPALTVSFPNPEYVTSNPTVTVTGRATDDTGVATVTVNGVVAALDPASGARDVSFSAVIGLARGPNTVETIATDPANNRAVDRRTVYFDSGPPVLDWTPEDGTTLFSSSSVVVTVAGTARDDAGIQGVTVNGQAVAIELTGGLDHEVRFMIQMTVSPGDNYIEAVATDVSKRVTAQTHKVTVVPNRPPVAEAGPDQTIEATSPQGASVTLNGLGSSDPDGDSLIYSWSGAFGAAAGSTPTVTLSLGIHTITLTVTDTHGASSTDSVYVSVVDTTPPTITVADPGSQIVGCQIVVSYSATDAVSGVVNLTATLDGVAIASGETVTLTQPGSRTIVVTAVDGAGNRGTRTVAFTVTYNFIGFLEPINNDGSSIFKLGSTVPIKFRLTDCSGAELTGVYATLRVFKIADAILGTVEEVAVDSSGSSNTDNIFRYGGTVYIYNLGTKGYSQGTYRLEAHLDDGTIHTVLVSLKNN